MDSENILLDVDDVIMVLAWDPESFHRRVLEFEEKGYRSRLESYKVAADMNPETGMIIHLYSIEMFKPSRNAH